MRCLSAAAVVAVTLGFCIGAADPPPPSIEKLIEQLGADDFQVREAAAKAIEALGPRALPALRKAQKHPDPDIRARIDRWIPEFERAELVAPRRVTLKRECSLKDALAEITRQSGYKVELAADQQRDDLLSFQLEQAPFWKAVDQVCAQAGAIAHLAFGEQGVRVQYQDATVPHVHYHDCFRMVAQSLHVYRSYQKSNQLAVVPKKPVAVQEHKSENLQFQFLLAAEPRLTVVALGNPVVTEAVDDHGRSLLPKVEGSVANLRGRMMLAELWAGGRPSHSVVHHAHLALLYPAADARKVKRLYGSVPVFLEKEKRTVTVAENVLEAKGKKAKAGDLTIEIHEVKPGPNNTQQLRMTATRPKAQENGGMDAGLFELLDDKGNLFDHYGHSISNNGATMEWSLHFGPPFNGGLIGPPRKLVYTTILTHEVAAIFEFSDLPLP